MDNGKERLKPPWPLTEQERGALETQSYMANQDLERSIPKQSQKQDSPLNDYESLLGFALALGQAVDASVSALKATASVLRSIKTTKNCGSTLQKPLGGQARNCAESLELLVKEIELLDVPHTNLLSLLTDRWTLTPKGTSELSSSTPPPNTSHTATLGAKETDEFFANAFEMPHWCTAPDGHKYLSNMLWQENNRRWMKKHLEKEAAWSPWQHFLDWIDGKKRADRGYRL